ncbi:MAG: hypothetical protein JST00_47530 [Deltaproteobacteria bacterium]|nr:hypothetical protein [Deltaproteobacteria bacterium]
MRRFTRAILLAAAVVGSAGCDGDTDAAEAPVRPEGAVARTRAILPGGRVVLVTIDGVRWQEGPDTCGVVRAVGGANVSMPGYIEIFTGDRTSPRVDRPTIFDEVATALAKPATSIDSWPVLEKTVTSRTDRVGVSAGTMAWRGPAPEHASGIPAMVAEQANLDPGPGGPGYRPDAFTSELALAYLREERPALFHVGLVDTDEWAHKDDYPRYLTALRHADEVVGAIADHLEVTGALDRTTVIVAADRVADRGPTDPRDRRRVIALPRFVR